MSTFNGHHVHYLNVNLAQCLIAGEPWKVTLVTGKDKKASPKCDVVLVIYGEEDKTDDIVLSAEDEQRFKPGATDSMEVRGHALPVQQRF